MAWQAAYDAAAPAREAQQQHDALQAQLEQEYQRNEEDRRRAEFRTSIDAPRDGST